MEIRQALESDAAALLDIYAQYIDTSITFETELPSVEEFARRIKDFSSFYPYLVSVEDGRITGYAYAHRAFERAAYRFDAEVTIYLDGAAQHTGVSDALYKALLGYLKEMNVVNAYAVITEPNRQSVYFHQKLGFKEFATFTDSGYKNGQWVSVVWMVKVLNEKKSPQPELRSMGAVLEEKA